MAMADLLVAILVGAVQGVVEWLPISSEGTVALVLTLLDYSPTAAVQLALFLHVGTALAASVYYRYDLLKYLRLIPAWRTSTAFSGELASLSFLVIATLVSGGVGFAGYVLLLGAATELTGGAFIALIGALLVVTGFLQRIAAESILPNRNLPRLFDAVLVGVGQGLAILPGISRSGTTVSLLLLRGYDGETSFELSFILSIPAALGAGGLAFIDASGSGTMTPTAGAAALLVSALVGYAAIEALLAVVRRVAFWGVCVGFGGLAVLSGVILTLW